MIEAELAYAFALGMVATVNPCGFAMLPAYLSYFLGLEGAPSDAGTSVLRALGVGAVVTGGFVAVFGAMGLAISQLSLSLDSVSPRLPWVTLAIGIALVALGVAMARGFQLSVRLPKVHLGSSGRELSSMFLFGISYAVASLSCTLPIFLPVMTRTFETSNLVSGVAAFLAYASGMGVLLSALTIALSLARGGLVHRLRRVQPQINRLSGALLVVAGAYLAYYGYWELRVYDDVGDLPPSGPIDAATRIGNGLHDWIIDVGPERVGIVLAAAIAVAVVLAVGLRRPSRPRNEPTRAADGGPPHRGSDQPTGHVHRR